MQMPSVDAFSMRFLYSFSLCFIDAFSFNAFFLGVFSPIVYNDKINIVLRFHLKHIIENSVHI